MRLLAALVACASGCGALALAWHHPLWPVGAVLACLLWTAASVRWPQLWQFAVPAAAPLLSFAPWTGWIVADEFDLLLLCTLCGGYGRYSPTPTHPRAVSALLICMAAASALSLARAFADAGGFTLQGFADYTHVRNSLRVAKGEGYPLLLAGLMLRHTTPNPALFARGMVTGLCGVVAAVVWERYAFVGLLDFSSAYRTTALFWEMHVGGEAIDTYLALATPFAVWAVVSARNPLPWAGAATLAVLTAYAVLTTFSRGVLAAVLTSLVLLAVLLLRQHAARPSGWRAIAARCLAVLLVAEVAAVVGTGGFMLQRLGDADTDLHQRMQHWQRGLRVLHSTADTLLGIGQGRLPARYAAQGADGEFSGSASWASEPAVSGATTPFAPTHFATLRGPATRTALGGQFALTQRTRAAPRGTHTVRLVVRVTAATDVQVQWCERHVLYDGHCQTALLHLEPPDQTADTAVTNAIRSNATDAQALVAWQTVQFTLQGDAPAASPWAAPRPALFTLSVVSAGGYADFDAVRLFDAQGQQLLHNADFHAGLARWWIAAQSYFLPWHIDNLALELLIERGVLGLLLFCALLCAALWRLCLGGARHSALAPYQAGALVALLLTGLTGSVIDVPRVALLLYLLALGALLQNHAPRAAHSLHAKSQRQKNSAAQTSGSIANGGGWT